VQDYLDQVNRSDEEKVKAVTDAVQDYLREANKEDVVDPKVQAVTEAVRQYLEQLNRSGTTGQAVAENAPSVYENQDFLNLDLAIQAVETIEKLHRQCAVQKDSRYVWRMLRWMEWIRGFPEDGIHIGPNKMKKIYSQVTNCVNFELVFDSHIQTDYDEIGMESHVLAEGVRVKYDPKTGRLTSEAQALKYLSFSILEPPDDTCRREQVKQDGTLSISGGRLETKGRGLVIHLQIQPVMPSEKLLYTCLDGNSNWMTLPEIDAQHWSSYFMMLHDDLLSGSGSYLIKDWKVTGGKIYAEAIYADRNSSWEGVSSISTTFLQLIHDPR
jgi:hypothetical protein